MQEQEKFLPQPCQNSNLKSELRGCQLPNDDECCLLVSDVWLSSAECKHMRTMVQIFAKRSTGVVEGNIDVEESSITGVQTPDQWDKQDYVVES